MRMRWLRPSKEFYAVSSVDFFFFSFYFISVVLSSMSIVDAHFLFSILVEWMMLAAMAIRDCPIRSRSRRHEGEERSILVWRHRQCKKIKSNNLLAYFLHSIPILFSHSTDHVSFSRPQSIPISIAPNRHSHDTFSCRIDHRNLPDSLAGVLSHFCNL